MEKYDKVAKIVAPKKASLAKSEAELEVVMAALNKKKRELQAVEADLQVQQNLKRPICDHVSIHYSCDYKRVPKTSLMITATTFAGTAR